MMDAKLNPLQLQIIEKLGEKPQQSSSEIFELIDQPVAYATVKRAIKNMLTLGYLELSGRGKASRYSISGAFRLLMPINVEQYFEKEMDERSIESSYNHSLIQSIMRSKTIFNSEEQAYLDELQNQFKQNTNNLSDSAFKMEFERLAIDLSWKSSQIEGNTYSLLETERLIKLKEMAIGKSKDEAVMLLNHKEALDFIVDHLNYLEPLTVSAIEDIHSILIRDLNVERNLRQWRVGISGTNYKPLDNVYQIKEAMKAVCDLVNASNNVFEKAFLVLLFISYIQPFADGNKRTARIISNALLMHHHYCPISYRTIDSIDYKKAMLIFYEQNNMSAFKKIFIDQFAFAVKTYF